MKKIQNFAIILGIAAFLFACGGGTEVAWKNGLTSGVSSDSNSMGDIEWVKDNKTWNDVDSASTDSSGGLAAQNTSASQGVESTTSDVQLFVFMQGWNDASMSGVQLEEGQSQTKEIIVSFQ